MKVIQLSTYFHPSVGGVERQVEEIATHLHADGVQVQVFTTNAIHGRKAEVGRLDQKFRDVSVRRFKYLFGFGAYFRLAPGLIWALCTEEYDIVHVHNSHDAHLLLALIIRAFRGKKLVLTGHNPYVVDPSSRSSEIGLGVGFYDLCVRGCSGWIDRYVALLDSERQTVVRKLGLNPHKVVVIPNGIQELFYTEGGNAQRFFNEWKIDPTKWSGIVGSACRLNYVKGLQNLRTAVKDLPKTLFIFAGGDDGYLANLKRMFRDAENVVFTERYLPSDEVKDFYQAIDLFLLPSLYEPFGMTLVEAMAQGRMVLSSNIGGPIEIIPDSAGELLNPEDEKAWSKAIKNYIDNTELRESKSQAAKQVAAKYQWTLIIKQIEEVYGELVS